MPTPVSLTETSTDPLVTGCSMPSYERQTDRTLWALRTWLDSWGWDLARRRGDAPGGVGGADKNPSKIQKDDGQNLEVPTVVTEHPGVDHSRQSIQLLQH